MRRSEIASVVLMIISLICLASCVGCTSGAVGNDAAYEGEGVAVAVLALGVEPIAGTDSTPSPDDSPKPGDKCPDCRGTGKSGDGIGRCGSCGGDGRIDEKDIVPSITSEPADEPRAADQPDNGLREITLHVSTKNYEGWPQEWWVNERPKLIELGWTISVVRDWDANGSEDKEPWFEVKRGEAIETLNGPRKAEEF